MDMRISNQLIKLTLDEYVVGHEEAKKALITMLSRSRIRAHQKYVREMDEEFLLSPMKVLLIGSSGTGKTHLLESLRKCVYFPLVRADATNLTPSGAGGGVKSEDLRKLITKEALKAQTDYPWLYPSHEHALDRTVVFVDEIDKLGTPFESSGNWNKHVQSNFLTLFDNKDEFSGVSFVFAGAFSGITHTIKDKSLGFTPNKPDEVKKEFIDLRVLRSGLIPEIVGRITAICELDVFTEDDLYNILVSRVLSKKLMDLAAYHILDAVIPEERLREIAKEAAESGQGVRYLQRAIDKEFLEHEFNADVTKLLFE